MIKRSILAAIILLNCSQVWAEVLNIVVVGLFKDQVVLEVNHKQRSLKLGEQSPEGITLISANSASAVLEKNGIQKEYLLGTHVASTFSPPVEQTVVSLWPTNGMYMTPGSINGFSVDFLVDTGASAIALNAATAERLGIDFRRGKRVGVRTASGVEAAYQVTLDSVQVGAITLHNIRAMVLDSSSPEIALLGMTFLEQLDIHRKDERLDLKRKF
jgi:aspartyl protease family protein